eukprot:3765202-Rhodomonas_salina.1
MWGGWVVEGNKGDCVPVKGRRWVWEAVTGWGADESSELGVRAAVARVQQAYLCRAHWLHPLLQDEGALWAEAQRQHLSRRGQLLP